MQNIQKIKGLIRSLAGVPSLSLFLANCTTVEIRKEAILDDFSAGKFEKYEKMAEDSYQINVVVHCDDRQSSAISGHYHPDDKSKCKSKVPKENRTFIVSISPDDFKRDIIVRGKKLHSRLKEREGRFLNPDGSLVNDRVGNGKNELSTILEQFNNYPFIWEYKDPVEIAYQKRANDTVADDAEKRKKAETEREEIKAAFEKRVAPLKKKYGIGENNPPRTDLLMNDYSLKGKNFFFTVRVLVMSGNNVYQGYCNDMPCYVASKLKIDKNDYVEVVGQISGYDFIWFGTNKQKVPIVLVHELVP